MNTKVRLGSCEGDQGLEPNPKVGFKFTEEGESYGPSSSTFSLF